MPITPKPSTTVASQLDRLDEAIAHYGRAIAINPAYAHALNNRGVALCAAGRFEEALADYARVLALEPAYAEAHHNRGIALAASGRFEDALASYDRALALRPAFPEALAEREQCRARLGEASGTSGEISLRL
jgi:tetratricopeptide (TPR) repeat protein